MIFKSIIIVRINGVGYMGSDLFDQDDDDHASTVTDQLAPDRILPGHEHSDFQPSPVSSAVRVFQHSMQQVMPGVSRTEATAMLQRKRSDSITKDVDAIKRGEPEAEEHVKRYHFMNPP